MIIDFSSVRLDSLYVHWVGNKLRDENIVFSTGEVNVGNEQLSVSLLKYFLSGFKGDEVYNLSHPTDVNLNELFAYSKRIFRDADSLMDFSKEIAKHLYECSTHPKVAGGELSVCLLSNCSYDGQNLRGIGIFKSETKDQFVKMKQKKEVYDISIDQGFNLNSIDKGCLILNVDKENGYKVFVIESRKNGDAQYWRDEFVKVAVVSDSYQMTKNFLSVAKEFVTNHLVEEKEISKADQIDILNKSMEYFKENESFNKRDFEQEVFGDKEIINSFRKFDDSYRKENSIKMETEFDISHQAVKKQARVFKSVLKLDRNFQIFINGDKNLIEKGTEKDGRKYYKIYYEQEF